MITIRRYANVAEAGFAKSLLISEGIDAFLADEEAGALGPQFVPWGMRLQVREEDEQRANKILAEKENETKGTSVPPAAPAKENPPIKCPGCGAEWALTDEEMAQPTFSCPDCGAAIPHETEISALNKPAQFNWHIFLPRSESKVVFILTMMAYVFLLQRIVTNFRDPLIGTDTSSTHIIGWGPVSAYLIWSVILTPIWETLVLVGLIEAIRRIGAPMIVQIILSTAALATIDGFGYWPHGLFVIPFFAISGISYLYWRPQSWRVAIAILIVMHALGNSIASVWDVCKQIDRERVSLAVTGDPYSWDRANALYVRSWSLLGDRRQPSDAISALQQAIALYPYDPRYHQRLGLAFQFAGRPTDAEREFRKAVEMNGTDAAARERLGHLLFGQKRFAEARDAFQDALPYADPYERSDIQKWIANMGPTDTGTSH